MSLQIEPLSKSNRFGQRPILVSCYCGVEAELAKRTVEYVSTENLYRLSALVRAEIRKVCQTQLPLEDTMAPRNENCTVSASLLPG